jgi:hypothetical protein
MGFLKHLLFWPVTGPTFLARFSLEKVQGVVRDELTDENRIKEELLDLQLRLELGDIDDEQYVREETALMEQLREVRHWREEFGMGSRGGVVRVAERSEEEPEPVVPPGATLDVSLGWDEEEAHDKKDEKDEEEER